MTLSEFAKKGDWKIIAIRLRWSFICLGGVGAFCAFSFFNSRKWTDAGAALLNVTVLVFLCVMETRMLRLRRVLDVEHAKIGAAVKERFGR